MTQKSENCSDLVRKIIASSINESGEEGEESEGGADEEGTWTSIPAPNFSSSDWEGKTHEDAKTKDVRKNPDEHLERQGAMTLGDFIKEVRNMLGRRITRKELRLIVLPCFFRGGSPTDVVTRINGLDNSPEDDGPSSP